MLTVTTAIESPKVVEPDELAAVTVYVDFKLGEVGAPVIWPLCALIERPAGRAGATE
jgi:hypothetical protein